MAFQGPDAALIAARASSIAAVQNLQNSIIFGLQQHFTPEYKPDLFFNNQNGDKIPEPPSSLQGNPAEEGFKKLKTIQSALSVMAALQILGHEFPQSAQVKNFSSYDYLIIGGGTAGCIVANRLTDNPKYTVLMIDAGTDPTLESNVLLPSWFLYEPGMSYDYNFATVNDHYTAQYLREKYIRLTYGKMLGGDSGLSHMLHTRGDKNDFTRWATLTNDQSFNYDGMLPYFIKSEKVTDKQILNSPTGKLHGTKGYIGLTRQISSSNDLIFQAFIEAGNKYNLDINSNNTLGITNPFIEAANDKRSSTSETYLTAAKNRKNLYVWKLTTVTRILFDKNKNAIGVTARDLNNQTFVVYANKEIILAAGAIKSPKMLLLSGVGGKSLLDQWKIPQVVELPVGQNLQSHVSTIVIHQLQKTNETVPDIDPHKFPLPVTVLNKALDPSQSYPDYQAINLFFHHDSEDLIPFCSNVFQFNDEICNKIYYANKGRNILFTVFSKLRSLSTGKIVLNSTDHLADPIITVGFYTNPTDLNQMASYLLDFSSVANTKSFKAIGAELLDFNLPECSGLPKNTKEFWRCYALALSNTVVGRWCCTCAISSVVDTKLFVKGVKRLRIADASAMPNIVSGNTMASIIAFAEKAADLIKADMN